MTLTSTSHIAQIPKNPSPERTPEWLYNEIMRYIHPDLMTDRLPYLSLKYSGESECEKAARLSGYDEAFRVFDEVTRDVTKPIVEAGREAVRRLRSSRAKEEHAQAAADLRSAEDFLAAA